MLTYEEFKEELLSMLPDFLPEELRAWGVSVEPIVTTNDQHRDFITPAGITENFSGKPIMYLDEVYQQYQDKELSMESVCEKVGGALAEAMNHVPDVKGIESQIRSENIFCCMINLQGNQEYLKDIPHLMLGDLAAVYKIHVRDDRMGQGAVTINYKMMERMGMNEDQLFAAAYENMNSRIPFIVERIEDALMVASEDYIGPKTFNDLSGLTTDSMLYVISNQDRIFGSGVLLMKEDIEKLSDYLDASLILIPSSVHEIIAVPDKDPELVKTCITMVKDVNESTVDPKERLSDSIYRYDRDRGELEIHTQDGQVHDMKLEYPDTDREHSKKEVQER